MTPGSATPDLKSHGRIKQSLPETVRQAKTWDTVKNQVMRAGICEKCAAQYAWGMQIGFVEVKPPCDSCAQLVALYDTRSRPNGWRTMHKVYGSNWQ